MNNIPSFFHTPYEPGISLREDIFNRQFIAEVMGSVEYLEDDRNQGSFYRTESLQISGGATIAEIIDRLMVINRSDSWPIRDEEADYYDPELGHDCGPQSFYPGQIRILDRFGRLVIGEVLLGMVFYGLRLFLVMLRRINCIPNVKNSAKKRRLKHHGIIIRPRNE